MFSPGLSAMNLQAIIDAAANDADDYLAGVTSMTEARPAIRDFLDEHYPDLQPVDVPRVVAGVLAILDDEGFFGTTGAKDAWAGEDDGADDE